MSSPTTIGRISSSTNAWIGWQISAIAATISISSLTALTSGVFIPTLLKPVADAPSDPIISLDEDPGRLTPLEPTAKSSSDVSSNKYKTLASQFTHFTSNSGPTILIIDLIAITAFGASAWRARNVRHLSWPYWFVAAAVTAADLWWQAYRLRPLEKRIERLCGEREQIEPYEDAPLDRAEGLRAIPGAVEEWDARNAWRKYFMTSAAAFGTYALLRA